MKFIIQLAAVTTVALSATACTGGDEPSTQVQAQAAMACGGGSCAIGRGIDLPNFGSNVVADWQEIGRLTVSPAGSAAGATLSERIPTYDLDMPVLNVALYDALALLTGRYQPFTPRVADVLSAGIPADTPANQEYAAHGAACTVLAGLFPSRADLDPSPAVEVGYGGKCAALHMTAGDASAAFDFGAAVAARVLAWRQNDNRDYGLAPYVSTNLEGAYRRLNSNPFPVGYTRSFVRPFSIESASQFRADPPPALSSAQYRADLEEVRAFGRREGSTRSPAQTMNAMFMNMPPPQFWMRNLQQFASSQPTLVENARLMAAIWVAQSDAITGCFDTKYHYAFWRPRTAINLGDSFGHAADPTWVPIVGTPDHPEYPSAHSCASGAMAEVLKQVFGTKKLGFSFNAYRTVPDLTNFCAANAIDADECQTSRYQSTDDFMKIVQEGRIAGGMHFRTATTAGDVLGTKVAKHVLHGSFQPVR
jgi:hypothetical protein